MKVFVCFKFEFYLFQSHEIHFQNNGIPSPEDEDRISSAKRKMLGNIKVALPFYLIVKFFVIFP